MSKEISVAQVLHEALHKNHDDSNLVVKEVSVKPDATESIGAENKAVERVYFNQPY